MKLLFYVSSEAIIIFAKLIEKVSSLCGFSTDGVLKYLKNTLWMFSERVLTLIIGFIVGIAVARHLGPANFGIVSYGLTLYGIGAALSSLGLEDLLIRDGINKPEDVGKIYGTAFASRFVVALLAFASCSIFAFNTTAGLDNFYVVVVVILGVLVNPVQVLSIFFQMNIKVSISAKANLAGYMSSAVIKIILIIVDAPLVYFAFSMLADYVIVSILLVVFYLKNGLTFKHWKFDMKIAQYFFRVGWPLMLMVSMNVISLKIDMLMINSMLDETALGVYSVAVRLSEIWYFFPAAIVASLFPSIVNSKSDAVQYESRVSKVLNLTVVLAIAISLFMTFMSYYIIKYTYGEAYIEAALPLSILVWCLVTVSFGSVTSKWVMIENFIIYGFYRSIVSIVLNIILNYFFIQWYGIKGAAIATFISLLFTTYFIDIFSSKTRMLFILKTKAFLLPIIFCYDSLRKVLKAGGMK